MSVSAKLEGLLGRREEVGKRLVGGASLRERVNEAVEGSIAAWQVGGDAGGGEAGGWCSWCSCCGVGGGVGGGGAGRAGSGGTSDGTQAAVTC